MPVLSAMDVTGAERKPRARPGAAVHARARPPANPEVRARRLADAAAEPRATSLQVFSAMADMMGGSRAREFPGGGECAAPIARHPDKSRRTGDVARRSERRI